MTVIKPFEIIKEENFLVYLEAVYNHYTTESQVYNDLYEFVQENIVLNIDLFDPLNEIITSKDCLPDKIYIKIKLYGRVKNEDDKYKDCLEYMISNL